mmetsp:Transcript_33838/g.61361  ORF Transcript_33838/g.61361 Transcript_33838/m.61361 type:complete len:112 (+) Transcript_33838:452-787(+)
MSSRNASALPAEELGRAGNPSSGSACLEVVDGCNETLQANHYFKVGGHECLKEGSQGCWIFRACLGGRVCAAACFRQGQVSPCLACSSRETPPQLQASSEWAITSCMAGLA